MKRSKVQPLNSNPIYSDLRTIKTCTGIGDSLWMIQKLINSGEKFNLKIANEDPNKRAMGLFDLLPQLISNVEYDSSFNTEQALAQNIQRRINRFRDIKDQEFFLTINHHLESGQRIEFWLEDLITTLNMSTHFRTEQYVQEVSELLPNGQKYIGIYMSSYSTNRHWGFWNENEWFQLISKIHSLSPGEYNFVIIGAPYDLDLATSLIAKLTRYKVPFTNTIGKNLGIVVEIMKKLYYGFYFPSGIGILAASLFSPHTMFFPKHLEPMMNTFLALDLIETNKVKHCQFCTPDQIYQWWTEVYK